MDELLSMWRSLVITRAMAEQLLQLTLRTGTDIQKAAAYAILLDAREVEEDDSFRPPLPKELDPAEQVKVKANKRWRRCLRCSKTGWLIEPNRLCGNCHEKNAGILDLEPFGVGD